MKIHRPDVVARAKTLIPGLRSKLVETFAEQVSQRLKIHFAVQNNIDCYPRVFDIIQYDAGKWILTYYYLDKRGSRRRQSLVIHLDTYLVR
jgi:hypothetical protein